MDQSITAQDKSLVEMDEAEALKQWQRKNSGGRGRTNKIAHCNKKLIKGEDGSTGINPDFGKVFAYRYEGDEEIITELPVGFEFFPVTDRVQVQCQDWEGFYCPEVDKMSPIEVINKETKEVVYSGKYKEGKEAHGLRYKVAIYAFYEGSIYRWLIGGGSMSSWFDIGKATAAAGRPMSVKLAAVTESTNDTVVWNDLTFELGGEFDVKTAIALQSNLEKVIAGESIPEENVEDSTDGLPWEA